MSNKVWNDSYSVNVTAMDDDHKVLFELIDALLDAMSQGHGKDKAVETVKKLHEYTVYHFTKEEELMKNAKYPGLEEQKKEHQLFISKIADLESKIKKGETMTLSIEMSNFLNNWLRSHIVVVDKKYGDVLKDK